MGERGTKHSQPSVDWNSANTFLSSLEVAWVLAVHVLSIFGA